jgi:hypothetical protein
MALAVRQKHLHCISFLHSGYPQLKHGESKVNPESKKSGWDKGA